MGYLKLLKVIIFNEKKKKKQAFSILNATERPWKTNSRGFNILRLLFLKRRIFCPLHILKAKAYRQTYTESLSIPKHTC